MGYLVTTSRLITKLHDGLEQADFKVYKSRHSLFGGKLVGGIFAYKKK